MLNRVDNNKQIAQKNFNQKVNQSIEFNRILENVQKNNELKISSHASDRLKERNINLSDADMSNLKNAVESIRSKGGKEALILYNNLAFITSVRNNTIITAMDSANLKNNVFTSIDSAIIL